MKKCYNCKYWTECSHNHGSAFDGYCHHPSSFKLTTNHFQNGDNTCCNWEDITPKEVREIDNYLEWIIKNSDNLVFNLETYRHVGADIIYTVTNKNTKQTIRVCKSGNGNYNIIEVNGYDVRNRYAPYYKEISKVFNYVDSFVKKTSNTEEDKIQKAIDSFKV